LQQYFQILAQPLPFFAVTEELRFLAPDNDTGQLFSFARAKRQDREDTASNELSHKSSEPLTVGTCEKDSTATAIPFFAERGHPISRAAAEL
jgi:hypothetical protein